jgi:phage repressor protein C with HTH and peptisase S24 domain
MDPQRIYEILEERRKAKGLSQTEVGTLAFGKPDNSPLQSLRRGSSPSVERLSALADVLGLELYFGEPRPKGPAAITWADEIPHHGFAKCSVQGWGKDQPDLPAMPRPDFINDPRAFYVTARGASMRPEGIDEGDHCLVSPVQDIQEGDRIWIKDRRGETSIKRLEEMTVSTLKLRGWMPTQGGQQQSFDEERATSYIDQAYPVVAVFRGNPGTDRATFLPDPRHVCFPTAKPIEGGDFGVIALHDVQAAAGAGRMNWTEQVISSLAFPTPWLKANGISPDQASLIYVVGTSMEPTLKDGSVVMINHNRTAIRGRRIYAFHQGGELRVKRLEQLPDGQVLVLSDNSACSSEIIKESNGYDFRVVGEVVWTAGKVEQKGI